MNAEESEVGLELDPSLGQRMGDIHSILSLTKIISPDSGPNTYSKDFEGLSASVCPESWKRNKLFETLCIILFSLACAGRVRRMGPRSGQMRAGSE